MGIGSSQGIQRLGFGVMQSSMGAFVKQKKSANKADKLQNHTRSAHGGVFDSQCRACVELRAQVEK